MTDIYRLNDEHLDGVAELERLCFADAWSKSSLKMLTEDKGIGFVAIYDGCVVAYGGMLCICGEGQITNIATHPSYRRKGLAKQIVSAIIKYAAENGITEIFLEVRRSNCAAIDLYGFFGFQKIGERKGFYCHPTEDAILMKYTV